MCVKKKKKSLLAQITWKKCWQNYKLQKILNCCVESQINLLFIFCYIFLKCWKLKFIAPLSLSRTLFLSLHIFIGQCLLHIEIFHIFFFTFFIVCNYVPRYLPFSYDFKAQSFTYKNGKVWVGTWVENFRPDRASNPAPLGGESVLLITPPQKGRFVPPYW